MECLELVQIAYDSYRENNSPKKLPTDYVYRGELVEVEEDKVVIWGYLAYSAARRQMTLCLRGTEGAIEWAEDIVDSDQIPWNFIGKPCSVHRGFHEVFRKLGWRESAGSRIVPIIQNPPQSNHALKPAFLDDLPENIQWIITGHSLGSPVAIFLSIYAVLASWGSAKPTVYSFAGPRLADDRFAKLYHTYGFRCYRIVNRWDIVPNLPPRSYYDFWVRRWFRYRHCGQQILVDGGATGDIAYNHGLIAYRHGLHQIISAHSDW